MIIGISIDQDPSLVLPCTKEHGLTFTSLLDPRGEVSPVFGVRYTPSNFFVNRSGQVIGGSLGYRDWDTPEGHQFIQTLLAEKADTAKATLSN